MEHKLPQGVPRRGLVVRPTGAGGPWPGRRRAASPETSSAYGRCLPESRPGGSSVSRPLGAVAMRLEADSTIRRAGENWAFVDPGHPRGSKLDPVKVLPAARGLERCPTPARAPSTEIRSGTTGYDVLPWSPARAVVPLREGGMDAGDGVRLGTARSTARPGAANGHFLRQIAAAAPGGVPETTDRCASGPSNSSKQPGLGRGRRDRPTFRGRPGCDVDCLKGRMPEAHANEQTGPAKGRRFRQVARTGPGCGRDVTPAVPFDIPQRPAGWACQWA